MKAAWFTALGAADVLQYGEQPTPEPAAGEVLVQVYASGVNPSDVKRRAGWGTTSMAFPLVIPHNDGAGVIVAVGTGVSAARVGERVWLYEAQIGRAWGTAAEYVALPSDRAIPLADGTSFAEAACLGVPAMTAHRTVFADGEVMGQTLLITGGAGAVGNYAVQWAKRGGATVITTVSRPEQALVAERAGADHIINYKTEDVIARIQAITGRQRGVNRIVDVAIHDNFNVADAVLRTNGSLVYYACLPDQEVVLPLRSWMERNITLRGVLVYTMPAMAKQAAIASIQDALHQGRLQHNIAQTFALSDIADAHRLQEAGSMIGKAVIEMPASS